MSSSAFREISGVGPESEDGVLRNIILLIFYELDLAVSSGDFGCVEIFLGALTMIFAGAGCKNYTGELLQFIQNLKNRACCSSKYNVSCRK
ncbi:hypothetical protein F4604DRAFT_1568526 [Suillus subluteus]|nr:hypothetical protein F4604DRAFT_1568526 [Suillus subluteus]